MTKAEAVERIHRIQRGAGVDRHELLDVVDRGEVAVESWNKSVFVLGVEYGAILGLVQAFGITREDLEPAGPQLHEG